MVKAVESVGDEHHRPMVGGDAKELEKAFARFPVRKSTETIECAVLSEVQVDKDARPEGEFALAHAEAARKLRITVTGEVVGAFVEPGEDLRIGIRSEEGHELRLHPRGTLGTFARLQHSGLEAIENEAGEEVARELLQQGHGKVAVAGQGGELPQGRGERDGPGHRARAVERKEQGRGDRSEMIAEPGDKVGLAVAGLGSGQEEEAAQSCRDPAGIAALQERLDRLQDLGKHRMMDPRDSRQLGRMVDKKIFQKGIGGVLFHKSLVRKISHGKNR